MRRADTLWELALRFRGDAQVNAQQAMIAILRANPDAFREGNINALRTGIILRVPTAAEMASITREEAREEFARHEEAWRNRSRTGSATPAPGPAAPARPAPRPDPASPPEPEEDPVAKELEEARATVAELRERLVERDDAIEELLVQLATARRELREARGPAPGTAPGPAAPGGDEAGEGPASGADWLPVSPLILGSSLIVLLVLIVVVTLLRQRGGTEEAYPDEPDEGEGEDPLEGEEDGEAHHEAGRDGGLPDPEMEEAGAARRETAGRRPLGRGSVGAATASAGAAMASADERAPGDEDEVLPVDESDDLPIGMDLEGEEEDWIPPREGVLPSEPDPVDPDHGPGFGRHVDVGELDDLEIEAGPARGAFSEIPEELGEDDPPPGRPGPGRPAKGRRE